ncbi:MAG: hypothetical protein QM765_39990 [Myxococcales bacterium]
MTSWALAGASAGAGGVLGTLLQAWLARRYSTDAFVAGPDDPPEPNEPPPANPFLRPRTLACCLAGAVACGAAIGALGFSVESLRTAALWMVLVQLVAIETDSWLHPKPLSVGGLCLALLLASVQGRKALVEAMVAAVLVWIGVMLLGFFGRIFHKETIGGGLPLTMAMVGAFVAGSSLQTVVIAAAVFTGVLGILTARRTGESGEIPTSPGLMFGVAVATLPWASLWSLLQG